MTLFDEPRATAKKTPSLSRRESGADGRTRTGDLLITNQLLYQLSYVGNMTGNRGSAGWAPTLPEAIRTFIGSRRLRL